MPLIDIERILLELEMLPNYDTQIGLQTVPGINDPFYATGKSTDKDHEEEEFTEFLFDLPYTNKVLTDLNVFRARVMNMKPKTCYTYHKDLLKRLHIPLITNENCFFIIEDEVSRYPADGRSYIIDTTKIHTFVNASKENRVHIIGCVDRAL